MGVFTPPAVIVRNAIRKGAAKRAATGKAPTPAIAAYIGPKASARITAKAQSVPQVQSALARIQKAYASAPKASGVPANIAALDVKFGRKFGIPASLLASQQRQESGFNPDAVSSAGAFGVSQFIPSTASSYGVKPGHDKAAVKSQVKGQAKLLTDLGIQKDPQHALSRYTGGYSAGAYNNPVLTGAKDFKSLDKGGGKPNPKDVKTAARAGVQPQRTSGPTQESKKGPHINPFPHQAWSQSRTDQGVDFAPKTSNAPIRAIGDATYVGKGQGAAWASGGGGGSGDGLLYKLHNAKGLPSPYIYVYEGLRTNPHLKPGQTIKRGQVIGQGVSGGSIEAGFADSHGTALAQSRGDAINPTSHYSKAGLEFQNFLSRLPGSSAKAAGVGSFPGGSSSGGTSSSGGGSSSSSGGGTSAKPTRQDRILGRKKALGKVSAFYPDAASPTSAATVSKKFSSKPVI